MRRLGRVAMGLAALGAVAMACHPAFAQAHNPFGVGISEGGGSASGVTGWLLAEQATFERQLSTAVRAAKGQGGALPWLIGLSFVYGVFHAAGPGHGKAVMASYLFANERALRRGLVLTLLAAVLQGAVAIALVGMMAVVFQATAAGLKQAASLVETLSYAGIALLGAWMVWRKGRALWAVLRAGRPALAQPAFAVAGFDEAIAFAHPGLAVAGSGLGRGPGAPLRRAYAIGVDCACAAPTPWRAEAGHDTACGHIHAPDPMQLGEGFSWREAVLTVVAAGSRPCSGAILVLVFALAQGVFPVGIAAVAAMALGTALTTGALAALAVLAKGATRRLVQPGSRSGLIVLRGLETAAAGVVLGVGLALVLGTGGLGGA